MTDDSILRLADLPRPAGEQHEMDPPHDLCLGDDPCICIHLEACEQRAREITLRSMDHTRCQWWEGWDSAFFAAEKALDALPVRVVYYENGGGNLSYGALDAAKVKATLVALRDQIGVDQIAVK